jgi:hypothetical protein
MADCVFRTSYVFGVFGTDGKGQNACSDHDFKTSEYPPIPGNSTGKIHDLYPILRVV